MNCRQCGAPLKNSDKFCPNCGSANLDYVEEKESFADPFSATNGSFYQEHNNEQVRNDPFRGNNSYNYSERQVHKDYQNQVDNPTCGLGFLSFMFPIVGFILYFVFKSSNKIRSAKHAAKWAWISIGIAVVFYLLMTVITLVAGGQYY